MLHFWGYPPLWTHMNHWMHNPNTFHLCNPQIETCVKCYWIFENDLFILGPDIGVVLGHWVEQCKFKYYDSSGTCMSNHVKFVLWLFLVVGVWNNTNKPCMEKRIGNETCFSNQLTHENQKHIDLWTLLVSQAIIPYVKLCICIYIYIIIYILYMYIHMYGKRAREGEGPCPTIAPLSWNSQRLLDRIVFKGASLLTKHAQKGPNIPNNHGKLTICRWVSQKKPWFLGVFRINSSVLQGLDTKISVDPLTSVQLWEDQDDDRTLARVRSSTGSTHDDSFWICGWVKPPEMTSWVPLKWFEIICIPITTNQTWQYGKQI